MKILINNLERESFENNYYNLLATAENILIKHFFEDKGDGSSRFNDTSPNAGENSSQRSGYRLQSKPQLPSIPLPKWDGILKLG